MTELHATLSPSSSDRWLNCPASVRASAGLPVDDYGSAYAREGTAAHALGELMARRQLLNLGQEEFVQLYKIWATEYSDVQSEEMDAYGQEYVDFLRARLEEVPDSILLLEQRLPTGVPNCWGTSDAVIVSPTTVEIVDLKYGKGVLVTAAKNPQLRLYGIGALESFGDLLGKVEMVWCTVYQPRLGHIETEELEAQGLRAWRDDVVIPAAELALSEDAPFVPSEEACRWCPVSGNCKAQMEYSTRLDFTVDPSDLTDDDLVEALSSIPGIRQWCDAVSDHALKRVYSEGTPIPGWKVVMSGGRRSVTDPEGALTALRDLGYTDEQIATTKIKGIGDLEKLLKKGFEGAIGAYVAKGAGSPSLAPEDDPRPAIDPDGEAAKDFAS